MKRRRIALWSTFVGVAALCPGAGAQPIYIEFLQGDLSDNHAAPSQLTVHQGSNELLGFMAGDLGGGLIDRDYFRFTVPEGMVLSQIILTQYFSIDPVAFLAVVPGPAFPHDGETTLPSELLGWVHLGEEHLGLDIMPLMGMQGQGFTPPLPSGEYSFWAQQLGEPTDYVLNFVVEVPAPYGLFALAPIGLIRRRRPRS